MMVVRVLDFDEVYVLTLCGVPLETMAVSLSAAERRETTVLRRLGQEPLPEPRAYIDESRAEARARLCAACELAARAMLAHQLDNKLAEKLLVSISMEPTNKEPA